MATRLNALADGDFGKIEQIIKAENTNEKLKHSNLGQNVIRAMF